MSPGITLVGLLGLLASDSRSITMAMVAAMEDEEDMCTTVMSRFRNSQQPEHKHLCAVVQAMGEVLREQNLSPTPTAYFAATMSSLDRQMAGAARNEAVTTALCTFLAMVLPKTPAPVLRSKGDAALVLLVNMLGKDAGNAGTVKAALSCLENVIRGVDKSNWLTVAPAFNLLLQFCLDQRPKVTLPSFCNRRCHIECSICQEFAPSNFD